MFVEMLMEISEKKSGKIPEEISEVISGGIPEKISAAISRDKFSGIPGKTPG